MQMTTAALLQDCRDGAVGDRHGDRVVVLHVSDHIKRNGFQGLTNRRQSSRSTNSGIEVDDAAIVERVDV